MRSSIWTFAIWYLKSILTCLWRIKCMDRPLPLESCPTPTYLCIAQYQQYRQALCVIFRIVKTEYMWLTTFSSVIEYKTCRSQKKFVIDESKKCNRLYVMEIWIHIRHIRSGYLTFICAKNIAYWLDHMNELICHNFILMWYKRVF